MKCTSFAEGFCAQECGHLHIESSAKVMALLQVLNRVVQLYLKSSR
jgi:hypothetical protein